MSSVVLQLLALGVQDVENFDFLDKPSENHMNNAFQQLCVLGAVEEDRKTVSVLVQSNHPMEITKVVALCRRLLFTGSN